MLCECMNVWIVYLKRYYLKKLIGWVKLQFIVWDISTHELSLEKMTDLVDGVGQLDISSRPALRTILNITYCGICSLPPEYCEFGTTVNKCKNWLENNDQHLYGVLYKGLTPEQEQEIAAKSDKEKAPKKEKVRCDDCSMFCFTTVPCIIFRTPPKREY